MAPVVVFVLTFTLPTVSMAASSIDKGVHTMYNANNSNNRYTSVVNTSINERMDSLRNIMTNLSELRSMCPGAVEFYLNNTDLVMFPVKVTNCTELPHENSFGFQHRWVYGHCNDSFAFCRVLIQVPNGMVVQVHVEYSTPPRFPTGIFDLNPEVDWRLQGFNVQRPGHDCQQCGSFDFGLMTLNDAALLYLSSTNQFYMSYQNYPPFRIKFQAVKGKLDIQYTSNYSGFVTMWYQQGFGTVCDQLKAPNDHYIMVSFE